MKVTLEISKYPLNADYEPPILDFIDRLNQHPDILVKTTATCTHVTGEYDFVMNLLQNEIKSSFEKYGKAIFVVKVLMGELAI